MRSIPKIMHHFQDGDTALIEQEHKVFVYSDGDWILPPGGELTVSLMEMNEQIMDQLPNLDDLSDFIERVERFAKRSRTLVLLQHDYHYITILHQTDDAEDSFSSAFKDCINAIGPLKGFDIYTDRVEIWLKTDKGSKMFILIPYDEGCVYYHG